MKEYSNIYKVSGLKRGRRDPIRLSERMEHRASRFLSGVKAKMSRLLRFRKTWLVGQAYNRNKELEERGKKTGY